MPELDCRAIPLEGANAIAGTSPAQGQNAGMAMAGNGVPVQVKHDIETLRSLAQEWVQSSGRDKRHDQLFGRALQIAADIAASTLAPTDPQLTNMLADLNADGQRLAGA
jgi:hypothetical protein